MPSPLARLLPLTLLAALALAAAPGDPAPPQDAPIPMWRAELLDVASRSAGKMPLVPHLRSRAQAQEVAVQACLQLDQPARALATIEQIPNWRKGTGYADLALWCAEHGAGESVPRYLELAQKIGAAPGDEDGQDWQRDRIRGRIARVHEQLGEHAEAERLGTGLAASDAAGLQQARADAVAPDDFDDTVKSLDAALAEKDFDVIRNALASFVRLADRFHDDDARRATAEDRVRHASDRLPVDLRIDLLLDLAGQCAGHGEAAHALEIVDQAQALADAGSWTSVDRISVTARLAARRAQAGGGERARQQLTEALTLFQTERPRIVDIERAGALRAVAEGYVALGDTAAALSVYRLALEEGVANPNSRPRADDLVATCCSMARQGVEPDEALWKRLHAIADALGDPW